MKVFVYECRDPNLPDLTTGKGEARQVLGKAAFVARIRCPMMGRGGKMVEEWHPVLIVDHTEEGAREKAETWWAAEVEAARAKDRAKVKAAPRAAEDAPEIEAI